MALPPLTSSGGQPLGPPSEHRVTVKKQDPRQSFFARREEEPNPFALPDEDVFLLRERERQERLARRIENANTKIWDKHQPNADAVAISQIRSSQARHKQATNKKQERLFQGRRRERENMADFIAKKREMFLIQMSLDTKKQEIQALENKVRQREDALRKAENMLEDDAMRFDAFLKVNDRKAHQALKRAEHEAKEKQEKALQVKKLMQEIAKVESEIQKADDQLKACLKYKHFLDERTPPEHFEAIRRRKEEAEQAKLARLAERGARRQARAARRDAATKKLAEAEAALESTLSAISAATAAAAAAAAAAASMSRYSRFGAPVGPSAAQLQQQEAAEEAIAAAKATLAAADEESEHEREEEAKEAALKARRRQKRAAAAAAAAAGEGEGVGGGSGSGSMAMVVTGAERAAGAEEEEEEEDEEEDMDPMYFSKPEQLLEIFGQLEERNLFLIQNVQETEEGLEELRQKFEETRETMQEKTGQLEANIEDLRGKIDVEQARSSALWRRAQGKAATGDHSKLLASLTEKVRAVYRNHSQSDTQSDPVDMLREIEGYLEYLLAEIRRLAAVDREHVLEAERARENARRARVRQMRREEAERLAQERLTISMARAKADVVKRVGKPAMFRSAPIVRKKKTVQKVERDEEAEEYRLFFTVD